ncbi:MAG: primosomal protein N', partial [Thermoproteota archaeon]|nr:primosomal protein N' [Thermoproteota archaeon]
MSAANINKDLFSPSSSQKEIMEPTWAEIILPLAIPKTYSYTIPKHLLAKAKTGCRAEVVFGKNKKYAGIIKNIFHEKPAYETKEILNIIDDEPIIYPQQLQLWAWISQYYMCSEGEVMAAALPTHLKLSSETVIFFNEDFGEDFSALDYEEYLVAEALLLKKELRLNEVQQILDVNHVYPLIKKLIEKKICFVWEEFNDKYKLKKENYVVLNAEFNNEEKLSNLLNNWSKAPKQLELLLSYLHLIKTEGEVTQTALLKKSNATIAQLKGLTEKHILFIEKKSVDRIASLAKDNIIDFELSEAQQKALQEIDESYSKKNVCLLHG